MPLETVPDLFDDATHHELDRAVEKDVEDDLGDESDLSSDWQYVAVLNAIVAYGKDMDKKYLVMKEAKNLIKTTEELRPMLASAWRRKSYREIRNLGWCLPFVPIIYMQTSCCSICQPFSGHRSQSQNHQHRHRQRRRTPLRVSTPSLYTTTD